MRETQHGPFRCHARGIARWKTELRGDFVVPELLFDSQGDQCRVARLQTRQRRFVQLDLFSIEHALERALPAIGLTVVEQDLLRLMSSSSHVIDDEVAQDRPHVSEERSRMPALERVQPVHAPLNGLEHHVLRIEHVSDNWRQAAGGVAAQ